MATDLLCARAGLIAGAQFLITAPVKIAEIVSRVVCLNCAATNKESGSQLSSGCLLLSASSTTEPEGHGKHGSHPLTWTETAREKKQTKQVRASCLFKTSEFIYLAAG